MRGFALIELLVVLAVIGIVVALFVSEPSSGQGVTVQTINFKDQMESAKYYKEGDKQAYFMNDGFITTSTEGCYDGLVVVRMQRGTGAFGFYKLNIDGKPISCENYEF